MVNGNEYLSKNCDNVLKFEMKYISIINTNIYTIPAVVNSNAIYNMFLSILFSTVRLAI